MTSARSNKIAHHTATPGTFITIQQAADYLGVNTRTVRYMVADGRLTAYSLGPRVIRLRKSDVDAALAPYGNAV